MKTLWTFGDSQTYGHGCRPEGPLQEYYNNYKKDGDDIWPKLLGNKLNCEVKNFGICGASNDTVLDTIIDNFDNIQSNDIVIIGKTFYERFDVPHKKNNILMAILGEVKNISDKVWWEAWLSDNDITEDEINVLIDFSYYYATHILYKERHDKRYDFIKKQLENKNVKVFFWQNEVNLKYNVEFIIQATKNKIKDFHFSFKGHEQFSKYMFNLVSNEKKIV
jgi:L-rhamnose mutarotase